MKNKLTIDWQNKCPSQDQLTKRWWKAHGKALTLALLKELNLISPYVKNWEVGLTFCGLSKMRSLNSNYRQKDRPTDVLSFESHSNLRAHGIKKNSPFTTLLHLGDVVVCLPVAKKQAKRLGCTLIEEITHLMVHGVMHLCGYDHELGAKEEKIMHNKEQKILRHVAQIRARQ